MLGHARVIGFLFRFLPVRAWKEKLWRHIDGCPACQARLASREDARRVLFQADDAGGLDGLWPSVAKAIRGRGSGVIPAAAFRAGPDRRSGGWRWVVAAAGLAAAVLATAGLIQFFLAGSAPAVRVASGPGLRIHYAKIAGQPAQTFVFQEQDPDMVIVWVTTKL